MPGPESSVAPKFKDLEQQGWNTKAEGYDAFVGQVTRRTAEPLLDAAKVRAGMRVLDVACGPGYVAAAAAARGAKAVGIDFAPSMVAEARRRVPAAEFRDGDAESLDFEDGTFDAVICAFGLLHMAEPDKAIAEAKRVLRPGGRFAFTVWAGPERHDLFALVLKAIQTQGRMDVPLPPAPPIFRFSDRDECVRALAAAGFTDAVVEDAPLIWRASSGQEILDMIYRSTVRLAMLLRHQEPDALTRIHDAIVDGAARLTEDGTYTMAWPAVLAAATR